MQKKLLEKFFFEFLNVYYPKTHLIKAINSPDSSRPNGRLSQNQKKKQQQKTRGFRELVLPGNNFKTSSTVNFPKLYMSFSKFFQIIWKAVRKSKTKGLYRIISA